MDNICEIMIPIANDFWLVAMQNKDDPYNKEIFIGIVDKSGVWHQDLAVVRNAYKYEKDKNGRDKVVWKDNEFDVLVYSDRNNPDFTHDFTIGLYQDEFEE